MGAGAALALALAGCAAPPPAAAPARHPTLVSLNPCTDAILAEVTAPGQLRAISAYSHDPAQSSMDAGLARRFPAISGTVEEVLALHPDWVVSGAMTPPATRNAMAALGLRLVELPSPRSVPESEAQVRQLAALAGQPARGEALVSRIEAALAQAAPPPGPPVSALVWQGGGMVPGSTTLITRLLARTGFASHSAARHLQQASILPLERVLADPPSAILGAGHAGTNEDRMLAHPVLAGLTHTRRFALDPRLEWCAGPTIIRAVARLAQVRREVAAGGGDGR